MRRADDKSAGGFADELMRLAVAAAAGTQPHPNPRVGAVVVGSDGTVLAERAHVEPGEPHAEASALAAAGDAARGGTLVVTLEPCTHYGRTPPCVDAILAAGIRRVLVGAVDPDERVAGQGIASLEAAGVEVVTGVAPDTVAGLDPGYFHHRITGRPLVTLKIAMTIDGQIAAADGTSRWITSEEARHDAHGLRADSDAVMIGAGTLRADDPRLDVRLDGYSGRQPQPIVVAGNLPLPETASLWDRHPMIYRPQHGDDEPRGSEVVALWHRDGVDLEAMMSDLGKRGVVDLLVEGGPTLAKSLLTAGLVDRFVFYIAGRIAGGLGMSPFGGSFPTLGASRPLLILGVDRMGPDLRIDAIAGEG